MLLSAGLALCLNGEVVAAPYTYKLPGEIGQAAVAGVISVHQGYPESFGGAISSVVSVNTRNTIGTLLTHASGVKIGPDKVLTANHVVGDLRGSYGPDPQPGYCVTEKGLNMKVGFSTDNDRGGEVSVKGVALAERRDLAVLTVDTTPAFDKIPSASVVDFKAHEFPIRGSGIAVAGYPSHGSIKAIQDPGQIGKDANVYVWTGPIDPTDNYAATIMLPPRVSGRGISGGPIIDGDNNVVGVLQAAPFHRAKPAL